MIKFAVAGSLDYLRKGVSYLQQNNYSPQMVIERSNQSQDSIENHLDEIKSKGVELLVCLAYPEILKKDILSRFSKGCINIHAGLPNYRGRHPLNWMLIDGVQEIPIAVHYMDEGIDTGGIITQDSVLVERDDDYNSVLGKITSLEGPLLLSAIKQIESGTVYARSQHKNLLRYTRKRTPQDSAVNLNNRTVEVSNFINALVDPMPNAFAFTIGGEKVNFKRAYLGKREGEVIAATTDNRYVISVSDGVILVSSDKNLKIGDIFVTEEK